jgi:hypothetical protein
MAKTKIIIDADIIIHFSKGGWLHALPNILKEYDYVILDVVYQEVFTPTKIQLDNQIHFLKNISLLPFHPKGEMAKEYALLIRSLGKGESACLVYCKYNHDVIGSSNLKDIKNYCTEHQISYLTTMDFLYYAIKNGVMTLFEANKFVDNVKAKDSKLPNIDLSTYISKTIL